jgi:hypothetical protein
VLIHLLPMTQSQSLQHQVINVPGCEETTVGCYTPDAATVDVGGKIGVIIIQEAHADEFMKKQSN